jgi:hypothetical protein
MLRKLPAIVTLLLSAAVGARADEPGMVPWRESYREAKVAAEGERKLLLVWFCERATDNDRLTREVFADADVVKRIGAGFVPVKVATDALLVADANGKNEGIAEKPTRLLDHPAFVELNGKPGLAIIDQTDPASPHFGFVVSIYPLTRGDLTAKKMMVLLNLPAGSLTQRTLIYAVRTHPDQPASSTGDPLPLLADESQSHSVHQASINLQGHHGWEQRFHSINARLPTGLVSYEVCAESWPGQSLLDAAEECVDSWRQSEGHWNQVSRQAEHYGYDMRRGTRGVWYATGIFARGR